MAGDEGLILRNLSIMVLILIALGINGFDVESQDEDLRVRTNAFFSNENNINLALNFANSLNVHVYLDGKETTILVDPNADASRIIDLAWNSTGELLAAMVSSRTGANDHWLVWEVATQQIILSGFVELAGSVEWHPVNLNRLNVATGVTIYDIFVSSGDVIEISRSFDGIAAISWNPLGTQLAVLDNMGRVYILSEMEYSVAFRIDENVPLSERQDFYFSFAWSPESNKFAVYDMLDTEIEIWNPQSGLIDASIPSFDMRPQHAEGILWTSVGIAGYVDTNDIGLYDPQTGQVIKLINQERSALFWDYPRQQFLYLPLPAEPTDLRLEFLPLFQMLDTTDT
jgi:WD40 repeat protein